MIYILICYYAHIHGITNAFLYSRKGAESLPANEHIWLVVERSLLCVGVVLGYVYGRELFSLVGLTLIVEIVSGVLAFSFFHNRSYYLMRDKIDLTNNGAKHQSDTTTAKLDFDYNKRVMLLYISWAVIIAYVGLYIYFE